jgi:hypothetical protein
VYSAGGQIAPIDPDQHRASAPAFSVTPGLPAGLSLDPATGRLSGTPTEVTGARDYTVHMHDRLGDADVPLRLHIDDDRYDAVAPSGTAGPAPTFTWTRASAPDDAEAVGSYTVVLDGHALATVGAGVCGPAQCSAPAPAPVTDGSHTWHVETTARDGHVRRTDDVSFSVAARRPPGSRCHGPRSTRASR